MQKVAAAVVAVAVAVAPTDTKMVESGGANEQPWLEICNLDLGSSVSLTQQEDERVATKSHASPYQNKSPTDCQGNTEFRCPLQEECHHCCYQCQREHPLSSDNPKRDEETRYEL